MAIQSDALIMNLTEAEVESMQAFGPDTDLILRWHKALLEGIDDSIDAEVKYASNEAAVKAQLAILIPLRDSLSKINEIKPHKGIDCILEVMQKAISQLDSGPKTIH